VQVRSKQQQQQPAAALLAEGAHQQMLYRLGVERDERVRLCELRDVLVARKASLAGAASRSSELKAAVDAQMETVTDAAAALQAELKPIRRGDESFHALAPLLPSPLYTMALTAAAYFQAVGADAALSITGDAEAAKRLAEVSQGGSVPTSMTASTGIPLPAGADGDVGSTEAGLAPHPLQLVIALRKSTTKLTVRYFGGLQLLAASAEPAKADLALRALASQLPSQPEDVAAAAGAGATMPDDGSHFPDLRSSLRWHKLAHCSGGCLTATSTAAGRRTGNPAEMEEGVASLLPSRPYRWLQWLGGLGPLLTSAPQPSQLVLEKLLKAL